MRELTKPSIDKFNVVITEQYFRGTFYTAKVTNIYPFDVFEGDRRIADDVYEHSFEVKCNMLYTFISDTDTSTLIIEENERTKN